MEDRGEREADQGRREGAAEDHDEGVAVREHAEIAAHQDQGDKHDAAGDNADAGCDIHG